MAASQKLHNRAACLISNRCLFLSVIVNHSILSWFTPYKFPAYFCHSTSSLFCMTEETILFFDACRRGDLTQVEAMLTANTALINIEDIKGFTPLIIAVYNGQEAIADYLLSHGAATDMQDAAGNTALMGACFKGYKVMAKKLLAAGADVNQRNFQNATALTFAATFGQMEIARMLLAQGADVHARDVRGKSPIDHAVIQENEAMVVLLEKYA